METGYYGNQLGKNIAERTQSELRPQLLTSAHEIWHT